MSNNKSTYDYGKCHVCGEQMKEKKVHQDFWLRGKLIVIESVRAGVCPQCGEKIVKADVGRQLATLIQSLKRLPKAKDDNRARCALRQGSRMILQLAHFCPCEAHTPAP